MLPDDYISKSSLIDSGLRKIKLYALSLVDIVITKAVRLNDRDWQDIKACVAKGNLTEEQISARRAEVGYVGNEATFETNIQLVVDRFLKKKGGNP